MVLVNHLGLKKKKKNLFGGPNLLELINLLFYCFSMLLRGLPRLLPPCCYGWVPVEVMAYELQVYFWGLVHVLGKNVYTAP